MTILTVFHIEKSVRFFLLFFFFYRSLSFSFLGFGLNETVVALEFDKPTADPALFLSAIVLLGCRITPLNGFLALGAFDPTLTHGPSFAPGLFVLIVTLLTFERSTTIITRHPRELRTNGTRPATFARIWAKVILQIIVRFLAFVTLVRADKKPRHFRNHVVVVVMHVQVNPLVFVWTTVNNLIVVLFRYNVNLILGQICLKLFGFFDTARTQRNACIGVKFSSHLGLHSPPMINNALVLGVFINTGFSPPQEPETYINHLCFEYGRRPSFSPNAFPNSHRYAFFPYHPKACSRESHSRRPYR